jgi:hypothetical protein
MLVALPPGSALCDDATLYGAIKRIGADQLHCGFVVKPEIGGYVLVDFAWHYDLRCNLYSGDYYCIETGLDKINQEIVSEYCLLVAEKNKSKIPYAFWFQELYFLPVTGEVSDISSGVGMTCATFVYAVLKSLGLPPIDVVDWPERPDDPDWINFIVGHLDKNPENLEHVNAIKNAGPYIRMRPDEVVGALSTDASEWPRHFEEVDIVSRQVRSHVF